ncbi:MAG: nucleoside triphosphate pyrophosphohydrolase [Actinomycetia bacterium]|nr:MazG nucleotide pyrophosphohydrolase domain-containing protein [Rothia kristinae]MDN5640622.1 nucleoside triphosphate pyrophosphohydrolase [Actinomycetes bacterium]
MRRLRSERGCPWDAAQTHASLAKYLLEETHEVIEAIESPERTGVDAALLREELGDVLLQVVFHARIAQETPAEAFDAAGVVAGLNAKMIRRHPHVFAGNAQGPEDLPPADAAPTAQERGAAWEELKRREKPERTGPFDGIPPSLPALARAEKTLGRAAKVGLDLPPITDPPGPDAGAADAQEALGEALLGLAVRARQLGVDPEAALRAAVRRYVRRVG